MLYKREQWCKSNIQDHVLSNLNYETCSVKQLDEDCALNGIMQHRSVATYRFEVGYLFD